MPELPEVETVMRALEPHVMGSTIVAAKVLSPALRISLPQDMEKTISSREIVSIKRRARYLLFELSNGLTMVVHLGMTGRLTIAVKSYIPVKHDHVILYLDDRALVYNDPRRFGLIDLIETNKILSHKLFANLGLEPFDKDFTANYLKEKLKIRQIPIKGAIMDNKTLVGVGNIYASEALFLASISPLRKANDLSLLECERLVSAIKIVLQNAIDSGGSSIRDFVSIDNNKGYFQHNFAVYGRAGSNCRKCSAVIVKIYQGGRATFFCRRCQDGGCNF